jgi:hypothetical protein
MKSPGTRALGQLVAVGLGFGVGGDALNHRGIEDFHVSMTIVRIFDNDENTDWADKSKVAMRDIVDSAFFMVNTEGVKLLRVNQLFNRVGGHGVDLVIIGGFSVNLN